MKINVYIAIAFIGLMAVCGSGCATVKSVDKQTVEDSAVILKSVARNAAAIAITENESNRKYVTLAVTILDNFIVGTDYTPGALTKALAPLVKEVKDVKIGLALNTVTDLYEIFYGRYAKQKIASNEIASRFLTALRDGAQQALEVTPL